MAEIYRVHTHDLDLCRVWTALRRGVHTSDFMFEALKDRRMPKENMHDVYCSQCGTLTQCRSRNKAEGGAADIKDAPVRVTESEYAMS